MELRASLSVSQFKLQTPEEKAIAMDLIRRYREEANDPLASPERLNALLNFVPLEVAGNPNIPIGLAEYITDIATDDVFSGRSPLSSTPTERFAILWALSENPCIALLRLEEPASTLHEQIERSLQKIRIRLALASCSKQELGSAYLQALKPFLHIAHRYNPFHYRTWLYHISALWRRGSGLDVPAHYAFHSSQSLPLRSSSTHPVYGNLQLLRSSLGYATSEKYREAFRDLQSCAESLRGTFQYQQAIMQALEAASMGQTWPDPVEDILHQTTEKGKQR